MTLSATERPTIINLMRNMKVDHVIPLEEVHRTFPNITKLYPGRPEMIIMKMTNGRNMQMFRGGKVQILGRVSDADAESMRLECIATLRKISAMRQAQVTTMTVSNLVISVQLKKALRLRKNALTDCDFFHETELFPAALIRKWHPVHIAAFHNGRIIFTGLKSLEELNSMLPTLISYLEARDIL